MKESVTKETLGKIGEYLRDIRESLGMSQAEVAQQAGFASGGYISVLEGGHREVSKKTLFKLSQVYAHVPLGDMVNAVAAIKRGEGVKAMPVKMLAAKTLDTEAASGVAEDSDIAYRLEGATLYIEHDRSFPMSHRPRTAEAKAMLVSMYQQQHPERRLLTDEELQRVIESE